MQYFGYGKSPVVWFGDGQPDALILSKLLDFLWPSLRVEFAACTYALQIMSYRKRTFNLMFAPRSAISRFSRLPDHQLVGYSPSTDDARIDQRSSELISAVRIGLASGKIPNLNLQRLTPFLPADPTALLKLSVLNELEARSESAPAAAVAMLDVLAALVPNSSDALAEKSEILSKVIGRVRREPPFASIELLSAIGQRCTRSAFRFLKALRREVRESIAYHAANEPFTALELLSRSSNLNGPAIAGIADGLERSHVNYHDAMRNLSMFSPKRIDALLAYSPGLAVTYLKLAHERNWNAAVEDVVSWHNRARQRVRGRLTELLISSRLIAQDRRLLEAVASSLKSKQVASIFRGVRRSEEFLPELARLSRMFPSESREALAGLEDDSPTVASLMASTFEPTEHGLSRLSLSYQKGACFEAWLTAAFLARADVWESLRQPILSRAGYWIGKLLGGKCLETSELVAVTCRLLEQGSTLDLVDYIEPGVTIENGEARRLLAAQALLSASFRFWNGELSEERLIQWLAVGANHRVFDDRMVGHLVRLINQVEVTEKSSLLLWQWAETLSASVEPQLQAIPDLVLPIFERTRACWVEGGTGSWCAILDDARRGSSWLLAAVQKQAFELAIAHLELPLSNLIVRTFPAIYSAATSNNSQSIYEFLFIFPDWDKGKELRRRLVDAFLRSRWPPGDLAITADSAGILDKILSRILRAGATSYVDAIAIDLEVRGYFDLRTKVRERLRFRRLEDWD
ncbi:hypothetical protein [Bradyrhizobium sp. 25ACV]